MSPSKPTNPSKPHKPVLSGSVRVSTTLVSGVGFVVCANVIGTGRSKLAVSIPVAIHGGNGVFFTYPTFLSRSESTCALGEN